MTTCKPGCTSLCCLVPKDDAPQCAKDRRCTARDGHGGGCVHPLRALVLVAKSLFAKRQRT